MSVIVAARNMSFDEAVRNMLHIMQVTCTTDEPCTPRIICLNGRDARISLLPKSFQTELRKYVRANGSDSYEDAEMDIRCTLENGSYKYTIDSAAWESVVVLTEEEVLHIIRKLLEISYEEKGWMFIVCWPDVVNFYDDGTYDYEL